MSSKLSKTALKGLIKECLIEILAEGLVGQTKTPAQTLKESLSLVSKEKPLRNNSKPRTEAPRMQSKRSNKNIENKISSVTSDPILAEMLADTAQTTLQEQVAADNNRNIQSIGRHGDEAAQIAESSNPEDLFGEEASSKWASLAFS